LITLLLESIAAREGKNFRPVYDSRSSACSASRKACSRPPAGAEPLTTSSASMFRDLVFQLPEKNLPCWLFVQLAVLLLSTVRVH